MPSTKSNFTARIGRIQFTCTAVWHYNPGEKMVMYYPDGSGYPGSPPEFDYVEWIEVHECEFPTDRKDRRDDDSGWGYMASHDRPDAFAIAERWILADCNDGLYIDDLFENAEDDDYA